MPKATYGVGTVLYEVTKRRKSEEYERLNASVSTIFPGMDNTHLCSPYCMTLTYSGFEN